MVVCESVFVVFTLAPDAAGSGGGGGGGGGGSSSAGESLEQSAAAYTKATAKRCLLEKVEVRTGEEAESNVLQVCASGD